MFLKSLKLFLLIYKDGKPELKNENIERKHLNIMQKKQFLKVKISLSQLEKDFIDLKDRETII